MCQGYKAANTSSGLRRDLSASQPCVLLVHFPKVSRVHSYFQGVPSLVGMLCLHWGLTLRTGRDSPLQCGL